MAEKRKKLLVISDSPSSSSGLGRICRDLTTRIHANLSDVYELATAGYGSPGSSKFGWVQYNLEGMSEWILPTLPEIVEDFAGTEPVTLMFVWDLHRIAWLAEPKHCEASMLAEKPSLREWAIKHPFKLWCYCPIDASGPNDRLTFPLMRSALGIDRLLAYGPFGEGVLRRTIGDEQAEKRHLTNLPHGIDSTVFYERSHAFFRHMFFQITGGQQYQQDHGPVANDEILIGIVATNLSRKDWPLALETCALLGKDRKIRVWIHTNKAEGDFSIPALLMDHGIVDKAIVSLGIISDDKLAQAMSACDITLGPGAEGWGLPIGESLACKTPVVTGSYAGAADFVPATMQVQPVAFRYEGSFASKRPVYNAADWAAKANEWIGKRCDGIDLQYLWENNWKRWEAYLRKAAE